MATTLIESIDKLKSNISEIYKTTNKKLANNIYKGHLCTMSSDVEDQIAIFLSKILPDGYKFFIDPQISVNKKNHRPDLLIINRNNDVVAMIEIKAQMGYCRNANWVIDKIIEYDEEFKDLKLNCNLKVEEEPYNYQIVNYGNNVKLFLISFSDWNCSAENHKNNKEYAKYRNVFYYTLFSGWYNCLENIDIEDFAKKICELNN